MKIEVIYVLPDASIVSEIHTDVKEARLDGEHLVVITDDEAGREPIAMYRGGDHLTFGWLRWKELA